MAGSQNGEGAIIGFSKSTEREKEWDYSVPMFFDELIFVTTKEKAFNFTGLNNMNGKRVAIKRGASYGDDFDQAIEAGYIKIIETSDRSGQMQMLKRDRVDAVLMSPGKLSLETIIAETNWLTTRRDDFVVVSPPYKVDPNHLGIPKSMNKGHLLTSINRVVTEMFKDGTHQKILDRVTETLILDIQKTGQ